jgi:hypothetical protein
VTHPKLARVSFLIARAVRPTSGSDHEATEAAMQACRLIREHRFAVVETQEVVDAGAPPRVVVTSSPLDFLGDLLRNIVEGAERGADAGVRVASAVKRARDAGRELAGEPEPTTTAGFAHTGSKGQTRDEKDTFFGIYEQRGARGTYVDGYTTYREAARHAKRLARAGGKAHAVYLEEEDGRGEYRELLLVVPISG